MRPSYAVLISTRLHRFIVAETKDRGRAEVWAQNLRRVVESERAWMVGVTVHEVTIARELIAQWLRILEAR